MRKCRLTLKKGGTHRWTVNKGKEGKRNLRRASYVQPMLGNWKGGESDRIGNNGMGNVHVVVEEMASRGRGQVSRKPVDSPEGKRGTRGTACEKGQPYIRLSRLNVPLFSGH